MTRSIAAGSVTNFDKRQEPSAEQPLSRNGFGDAYKTKWMSFKNPLFLTVALSRDKITRERDGTPVASVSRTNAQLFTLTLHILEVPSSANHMLRSSLSILEPRWSSGEIFKGRIYRKLKGRFSWRVRLNLLPLTGTSTPQHLICSLSSHDFVLLHHTLYSYSDKSGVRLRMERNFGDTKARTRPEILPFTVDNHGTYGIVSNIGHQSSKFSSLCNVI